MCAGIPKAADASYLARQVPTAGSASDTGTTIADVPVSYMPLELAGVEAEAGKGLDDLLLLVRQV